MALGPIAAEELEALETLLAVDRTLIEAGADEAREGRYTVWRVPKGDGRFRTIKAPEVALKRLQRILLRRLLYQAPSSPFAHGFVPGRSIVTNARVHAPTARALVSVDLEDAYPSVSRRRVRATLEWTLGPHIACRFPPRAPLSRLPRDEWPLVHGDLTARVCAILAEVCCHEDALPQGAPSSGALLNLVCSRLDRLCSDLVRRRAADQPDLRYSRYADDLTFTSSAPFEEEFLERVVEAVRQAGFRANKRKLRRTSERNGDLVICGVRLRDGRLGLPRRTLRRYRALFFQALAYPPQEAPPEVRAAVHGALGLLTMVTPACPRPLERPLSRLLRHHGSWLRPPRPARPTLPGAIGPYPRA